MAALFMFMLQAVLHSLQLYPSPVTNQGTVGALQPKCSSYTVHTAGPCCWHSFSTLCWARLWHALCGARAAHLWPASCVASRVCVYTAPAQRMPSLHSKCCLSTGCPAFLALLTHHVGMVPPAVGFGTTCLQGATCVVHMAALLCVIVASRVLFW